MTMRVSTSARNRATPSRAWLVVPPKNARQAPVSIAPEELSLQQEQVAQEQATAAAAALLRLMGWTELQARHARDKPKPLAAAAATASI